MPDVHDPAARSRNMRAIKSKNTRPEIRFRKALHREGFRYRLHSPSVPGRPDLVLRKYRAAIFVHGCFWHGHGCRNFVWPKTREEFWRSKISKSQQRDWRVKQEVLNEGWRHLVVWECSISRRDPKVLAHCVAKAARWIRGAKRSGEI